MAKNNILYSNQFMDIVMINPNYPFLMMKKNGVVTVPYDKDGNIYVLKKNRPNIGEYLELPRGFVEDAESYETGALRELLEETGLQAKKVTFMGKLQADTGIVAQNIRLLALEVEPCDDKIHYDNADKEFNSVLKMSMDDLENAMIDGQIVDNYTLAGVQYLKVFEKKKML